MEIVNKKIEDLKPYEKNPRFNDDAVQYVANSIKEFGFKVPIVVDKNNVIVTGHTRYKASLELGLEEVPCIVAEDLTDEQVKAYRLADNKVSEKSEWNYDLLDEELADILNIDIGQFDFKIFDDLSELDFEPEEKEQSIEFSKKVKIPQYEPTGEKVNLVDCLDTTKEELLIQRINDSDVTDEEKEFLRKAAERHLLFNYKNIAEYYANASKEMQELMEDSALVIIDINDAIAKGYVKLTSKLDEIMEESENADEDEI